MNSNLFRNPPKSYREVPFWSWNDDLDPQELVRQIELMDQAGWGGFFMHSRVGLKTPYMGRRWMECIRAGVEAARARGMGAWIYDEDKWPSGYAGGLSTAANPDYRARYLVCKIDNRPALLAERIATFAAREIDGQLVDFRQQEQPHLEDEHDRIVQFYPLVMPLGQENFNDISYLDLLNPEAVKAFLASTHQAYADALPEEMGKTIPGIFTDEPCYIFRMPGERPTFTFIPWTIGFEDYFKTQNGYDLLPHLPEIFFGGFENSLAYRYDLYRTLSRRFIQSYTQPISAWCKRNGIAYTGHYMAEDTLLEQMHWTGGVMPHYPYMDLPGIDKLWRLVNGYCGMVATVKQLDSVVCQMGKPRALCENYGGSGPDFAHTGRKWIGDWSFVLGITFNNPHLSLYSLRGERKRDWPQNLFYQQPWWPENRLVADYFARLSYLLSQGQRVVDILVIHPMGSAWASFQPGATEAIDQLDEQFDQVNRVLMRNQRDFHLADESLIAPGGATPGKVITGPDGPTFQVGKMTYRLVIVPPGVTLARSTVDLLDEFAKAGGPVIAVPPVPTLIDARPAGQPVLPAQTQITHADNLAQTLGALLPWDVKILDQPDIWVQHRKIDGSDCYFLANIDPDRCTTALVQLRAAGRVESWDAATGATAPCQANVTDGITSLSLEFPPAGSHLLMLYPGEAQPAASQDFQTAAFTRRLAAPWELTLDEPNAITLDTPRLKTGSGGWSQPMYILDARRAAAAKGPGTPFALRFGVDVEQLPTGPTYLALEAPERLKITINGQLIASQDCGWWVDISFRKLDLGNTLRTGANEIVLESVYRLDSEIESIYLVGNFGVKAKRIGFEGRHSGQVFDRYSAAFSLGALPKTLTPTARPNGLAVDLTDSGLPFLAGHARLSQTLLLPKITGKAVLEFGNLRAAVAAVYVNGEKVGACAWQPHPVDLGNSLMEGENRIEIVLFPTLRNLLGPHHRTGGDTEGTGPMDFNYKSCWTDDIILVPLGFDEATLIVTQ